MPGVFQQPARPPTTLPPTATSPLRNLEQRGTLFVAPGMPVYGGMIVGEHARLQDLNVNPLKSKQLTNIRAAG